MGFFFDFEQRMQSDIAMTDFICDTSKTLTQFLHSPLMRSCHTQAFAQTSSPGNKKAGQARLFLTQRRLNQPSAFFLLARGFLAGASAEASVDSAFFATFFAFVFLAGSAAASVTTALSTNCISAIGAESPGRGSIFRMRV
jgi:hypothetical protein